MSTRGDEAAFLTLYHRHQGSIFRFALHMSGQRETAEEVTQDVFLALLSESRKYSVERGDLQAYLIGVARNKVRRQLRQSRGSANLAADGTRGRSGVIRIGQQTTGSPDPARCDIESSAKLPRSRGALRSREYGLRASGTAFGMRRRYGALAIASGADDFGCETAQW